MNLWLGTGAAPQATGASTGLTIKHAEDGTGAVALSCNKSGRANKSRNVNEVSNRFIVNFLS